MTLNGEANSDDTLATVIAYFTMAEVGLYTSVTVTMVIYHTSCPMGPRYEKSNSYLHLGGQPTHIYRNVFIYVIGRHLYL